MERRFDIDWIRVIAIFLLIIYHSAICFQPWGGFIGFITNAQAWTSLWTPMTMLNIWRIPLLFYVSGMGLFLAMQNRNLKQVLIDRLKRIGLPLLFGSIAIVPLHTLLLQRYYNREMAYLPNMGHLWFLGNILLYVIILTTFFFFIKNNKINASAVILKKWLSSPLSLMFIFTFFVGEALLLKPAIFEMFGFTLHGFVLGLLAFVSGYLFMVGGQPFWGMLLKWRWVFFLIAVALFLNRLLKIPSTAPGYLLALESNCWIFAILAFAYKYLNKASRQLSYLKEAAYPVYILHMAFLYLGAYLIFPLKICVILKYILVLAFTFLGSLAFYELVVKRINIFRVFFGLKSIFTEKIQKNL